MSLQLTAGAEKYSTQKDSNGFDVLLKNGKETFCPFQQPLQAQTSLGTVQLIRLPCSTQCALASKFEDMFEILCSSNTNGTQYELELVNDILTPEESRLILD